MDTSGRILADLSLLKSRTLQSEACHHGQPDAIERTASRLSMDWCGREKRDDLSLSSFVLPGELLPPQTTPAVVGLCGRETAASPGQTSLVLICPLIPRPLVLDWLSSCTRTSQDLVSAGFDAAGRPLLCDYFAPEVYSGGVQQEALW